MVAVTPEAEKASQHKLGYRGLSGGKGHMDQSHAHSFSLLSTPTDKTACLDCSFVMAVSFP